MSSNVDKLNRRIKVLRFLEIEPRRYEWVPLGTIWAGAAAGRGRNFYSSAGIGADMQIVRMRDMPITLADALEIGGRHCIITGLDRHSRPGWLSVEGALVTIVQCVGRSDEPEVNQIRFPAIITEKYIRHAREEPMSTNTFAEVLITPKDIDLQAGGLVDVNGTPYEVLCCHTRAEFKNEYEIARTIDL